MLSINSKSVNSNSKSISTVEENSTNINGKSRDVIRHYDFKKSKPQSFLKNIFQMSDLNFYFRENKKVFFPEI